LDIIQCQEDLLPPIAFDLTPGEAFEDLKKDASRVIAQKLEELASSLEERKVRHRSFPCEHCSPNLFFVR